MALEYEIGQNKTNNRIPMACKALISGASAGLSVDISLYPIDTLKTRIQSPHGFWKSGGFRGVYNGLSASASGSAPCAALFFVTYESTKPFLSKYIHNEPLTHMLAASFSEITACLIRVPTEIIKQRMQTGQYDHLSIAIKNISMRYGIKGFYTGYGITVFREIPFSFIQFPLWEKGKLLWMKYINETNKIEPYQGAICGSISGGIAGAITTPMDVIKTRLMLSDNINHNGVSDCMKTLYSENGTKTFFKGIIPRVSWIFVGGFFFFGAYEKTKQLTGI